MFGYVTPDKNYLYLKDYALYQGVYCGICKATKEVFGNLPRIATNYDSVFLSALVMNLSDMDVVMKKQNCILHPFRRKNMAIPNEVLKKVGILNVLLLYYKLEDDVIDGGGARYRWAKRLLAGAYRKAARLMPREDAVVREQYEKLRELERQKCGSIDRVADCFGVMMRDVCRDLTIANDQQAYENLCYHTGRWIYLIDALDDLEKDHASGNFNVFLEAYGDFSDRKSFLEAHRDEIEFSLLSSVGSINLSCKGLEFHFNVDLIRNIAERGMRLKTELVMKGCRSQECSAEKLSVREHSGGQ